MSIENARKEIIEKLERLLVSFGPLPIGDRARGRRPAADVVSAVLLGEVGVVANVPLAVFQATWQRTTTE